jgi:hypothetical protein
MTFSISKVNRKDDIPIKITRKVNRKDDIPINTVNEHSVVKGTILIATPMKNVAECLDDYFDRLSRYDYPKKNISLAFLVSDSEVKTNSILGRYI